MSDIQIQTYRDVQDALERAGAEAGAADSQGALCGMVCAAGHADRNGWIAQMLGSDVDPADASAQQCRGVLETLYRETLTQLNDAGLDFRLLLPDDALPLAIRADVLGQWCGAFIYGLGVGGLKDEAALPADVREIVQDLSEISRVGFDTDLPRDEDEDAYTQIVEYVRMAVLLVHEELQPIKTPPTLQ